MIHINQSIHCMDAVPRNRICQVRTVSRGENEQASNEPLDSPRSCDGDACGFAVPQPGFNHRFMRRRTAKPVDMAPVEDTPPGEKTPGVPVFLAEPRWEGVCFEASPLAVCTGVPRTSASHASTTHTSASHASTSQPSSPSKSSTSSPRALPKREPPVYLDDEFDKRQNITGVIARVVAYRAHQDPVQDLVGLSYTPAGHVIVTALNPTGPAAAAHVRQGDRLVSINGRSDFTKTPISRVYAELHPLVTLVFLGFEGPLRSEVRVKRPPKAAGLATNMELITNSKLMGKSSLLAEAHIFNPKSDSLLLLREDSNLSANIPAEEERHPGDPISSISREATEAMFELQRRDAKVIVQGLKDDAKAMDEGDKWI